MRDTQAGSTHGSAYDLHPPSYDEELVLVGRGTPGGELLRRYWHPVAVAAEVGDLPVAVRALGEDLVLFRTPAGRFGLVYPRCCHRGTTLLYGKVETQGIRCGYHGWLFDPEGHCLDQPCEPGGGAKRQNYRQPWYPVEERYGLVFAYMGPPELKPALPRYDVLEDVPAGMKLFADGNTIPAGGPDRFHCNWFQTQENAMDPQHVPILHKEQFPAAFTQGFDALGWEPSDHGIYGWSRISLPGGAELRFSAEVVLPTVRIIPDPGLGSMGKCNNIGWTLPENDTRTRIFQVYNVPEEFVPRHPRDFRGYGGKTWAELDLEGHQRFPGDFEAQGGQGAITFHSEEHLASSDRGVALWRKLWKQALRAIEKGEHPPLAYGAEEVSIRVRAEAVVIPPPAVEA